MKIKLKVHSNSSQEKIKKINEKEYEIWINKIYGGKTDL